MFKNLASVLCASLATIATGYAQLNDVELGLHMYGATIMDRNHERTWVHFRSNDTHNLERHDPLFYNDDFQIWAMRCGAMTPEGYLGYMTRVYSVVEWPGYFFRMDVETGEYEVLRDMQTEYEENRWPVIYDLDYDWSRGKLYGVQRDYTERGYASSSLVEIDLQTGSYKRASQQVGFYIMAMGIDYDGYFYTVSMATDDGEWKSGTNLTKFKLVGDKLEQLWQKRIKVNGEEFMINYVNDLTFDYTTGDLYWAADNDDNIQRIIRIDPDNGDIYRMGAIGSYESIAGLYIPSTTAESRTAPAGVKGIDVSYADAGQSMTLGWTNPSTQWNREPLSDFTGVKVARDQQDNVVGTVSDVAASRRSTYTDNEASEGVHTYYIIPYNESGNGIATPWKVYVGEDQPGAVLNLHAEATGEGSITLSWQKPELGAHEGWIDDSDLRYDVVRMPDGVKVANGTASCTLTDTEPGTYDAYSYVVTAIGNKGRGTELESNHVLAGKGYEVPFFADFDSQHKVDIWTIVNHNGDSYTWEYEGKYGAADYQRVGMALDYGGDDYLISPKIHVEQGKDYRMKVNLFMNGNDAYHVELQHGRSLDLKGMSTFARIDHTIKDGDEQYQYKLLEGFFTADYTGDCYLSIRNTSEAALANIAVFDVQLEEHFACDLTISRASQIVEAVAGKTTQMTVEVLNYGSQPVTDYSVEVFEVESGDILGSATSTGTVAPGLCVEVVVPVTFAHGGKPVIAARVVAEGDQNTANNTSQPQNVNVNEGILDWNVEILEAGSRGERIDLETRVPFDFTYQYSVCQHIYTADEIGMEGSIQRIGYRYQTINPSFAPSAHFLVTVSMSTTSRKSFSGRSDWETIADQKCVFNGMIEIEASSGDHILSIDLDEPFLLPADENLVITIEKEGMTNTPWPIAITCFNLGTTTFRGLRHSVDAVDYQPWPEGAVDQLEACPQILMAIGDADGIETIIDTERRTIDATYDLQGRRISSQAHGLVIVNGEKVMVK